MLDFAPFSRELIETGDLDPVYIALYQARLPEPDLHRWLLAYGMFYHVGVASFLAEQTNADDYWDICMIAAKNEETPPIGGRWPRSSERRHFRGAQAEKAVQAMRERYPTDPGGFIRTIAEKAPDVHAVRSAVESHRGFGGWASFKFADLLDRVVGVPVKFDIATAMYDTPLKGAKLLWQSDFNRYDVPPDELAIKYAVECWDHFEQRYLAPPAQDRPVGFQELETCLCKWKSHRGGHYHIGKDIIECEHAAREWHSESQIALALCRQFYALKERLKLREKQSEE